MKYFLILSILFFSWRAFAEDAKLAVPAAPVVEPVSYEYYNIDQFIRAQEDPEYEKYLEGLRLDKVRAKMGVDEYKDEQEYQKYLQEQARLNYIDERNNELVVNDPLKLEREHEEEKLREQEEFMLREQEYETLKLAEVENRIIRKDPSRLLASLEQPRKKIPRSQRKFTSKNKRR